MKKLILSVVLLLTVSFAFAVNDVEKVSTVDIVTVELTNSVDLTNVNIIDLSLNSTTKLNANAEIVGYSSCTVSGVDGVRYTAICDCSTRRACRIARRLMRRAQE